MAVLTLREVAELTEGRLEGPEGLEVSEIAPLDRAGPGQLSFVVGRRYLEAARRCQAAALLVPPELAPELPHPKVVVENPYAAFALTASRLLEREQEWFGVAEGALVGEGTALPDRCAIHPGAVVGRGVRLGDGVVIHSNAVIGDGVELGDDCLIHPNVTIYPGCRLGRRVIVHAGAVIGSDGFGYAQHKGRHIKIPQTGTVVIEDDVEIGANTVVDRATLGETRIGQGTKIDNLVQVAHNVTIGPHSILVAQVGIAGSAEIGAGVMIGGQAGIVGHIAVGDGARIGAQAGVAQWVAPGAVVSGSPAVDHRQFLRISMALKRLPGLIREFQELKRRLLEDDER